jgi:hypothetical protein
MLNPIIYFRKIKEKYIKIPATRSIEFTDRHSASQTARSLLVAAKQGSSSLDGQAA